MNNIEITRFCKKDWETYKSLRLRSLKDAPGSFGSTFKREIEFTEEWKSRINPNRKSIKVLPLVVKLNDKPVGLTSGVVHQPESNTAHVYQMWGLNECRGNGIRRLLRQEIEKWAQSMNMKTLSLGVTISNKEAFYLYTSLGLTPSAPQSHFEKNLHCWCNLWN